jgi:hypothetical protein
VVAGEPGTRFRWIEVGFDLVHAEEGELVQDARKVVAMRTDVLPPRCPLDAHPIQHLTDPLLRVAFG